MSSESETADEFSLEEEPAIASESDDFMGEFIEENESSDELSLDSTPEMSSESE